MPLIVGIAIYIARQQWRTAHTKFRRDYYDRRLPIYRAAMTLAAAAMTKGTVSNEDLRGFRIKTAEARSFYNDEIARFLEEIQQQGLDLQICHKMMKEAPTEAERQRYADGWSKCAKWFTDLPNENQRQVFTFPKLGIEPGRVSFKPTLLPFLAINNGRFRFLSAIGNT